MSESYERKSKLNIADFPPFFPFFCCFVCLFVLVVISRENYLSCLSNIP